MENYNIGTMIHIKPFIPSAFDGMPGRFAPRIAMYGKVLYISKKGWFLVGIINKNGKQIFRECFFSKDIEAV